MSSLRLFDGKPQESRQEVYAGLTIYSIVAELVGRFALNWETYSFGKLSDLPVITADEITAFLCDVGSWKEQSSRAEIHLAATESIQKFFGGDEATPDHWAIDHLGLNDDPHLYD